MQIRDINAHGFNEDTNLWGEYKHAQFISLLTAAASAELNRRVERLTAPHLSKVLPNIVLMEEAPSRHTGISSPGVDRMGEAIVS